MYIVKINNPNQLGGVKMTKKIEKATPEFDALKESYEGMSNILSKAETGKSNPIKLAENLNEVFGTYLGIDSNQRLSAVTEPYQNQLVQAVGEYNNSLEKIKDNPRIFQNKGEILNSLEQNVNKLGGVFLKGSADSTVKELGIKPDKDMLKGINANILIEKLIESYTK